MQLKIDFNLKMGRCLVTNLCMLTRGLKTERRKTSGAFTRNQLRHGAFIHLHEAVVFLGYYAA